MMELLKLVLIQVTGVGGMFMVKAPQTGIAGFGGLLILRVPQPPPVEPETVPEVITGGGKTKPKAQKAELLKLLSLDGPALNGKNDVGIGDGGLQNSTHLVPVAGL